MLRFGFGGTVWAALALAAIIAAGWCVGQETAETGAAAAGGASPQCAAAGNPFVRQGTAHVIVQTTGSPTQNAANLLAAYACAKALTPNGAPLSATNRAVVLVAPGNYDLGAAQLEMDTEFVDLVGLSSARDDQYIHGTALRPTFCVLRQTADNVRIENLVIEGTGESANWNVISWGSAAYFPDTGMPNTVVRNCEFSGKYSILNGMSDFTEYAGHFEDCAGGRDAFGGGSGIASGTFINCTGGTCAFGGISGNASGTFINCTGGIGAFGGIGGNASGTFINCTGGKNSFGGDGGSASGTFKNCTGGEFAFGGSGYAIGLFANCTGGFYAFGGGGGKAPGGRFYHCVGKMGCFTTEGDPTVRFCIVANRPYMPFAVRMRAVFDKYLNPTEGDPNDE